MRTVSEPSKDIDARIAQSFVNCTKKGRGQHGGDAFTTEDLSHVTFVGECLIESFLDESYYDQARKSFLTYTTPKDGPERIFVIH